MEIIEKATKPPYIYTPPPDFTKLSQYEKDSYIAQEVERWVEGYNGLTGMHYFYLSQCKIQKGTSGDVIRPKYRDVDDWIFQEIEDCVKKELTLGVLKRREIGLTSIGAGCLPMYFIMTNPGCKIGLTSCDNDRVAAMFTDKTAIVYDSMSGLFRPKEKRRNQTKTSSYLAIDIPIINEEREKEVRTSIINCTETTVNPKSFSGNRLRYAFFDEFPLHPKREDLLGSSEACFREGHEKTGFLLWGGTVENGIPADSLSALQNIYKDQVNLSTRIFVVEGWMGMFMDEAGHSDKEKGLEYIEKELEKRAKAESKRAYLDFRANYPRNINDIFDAGARSVLSEDVMQNLSLRKIYLRENPPLVRRFDLYERDNGMVEAVENQLSGTWEILELPEPTHTYIAGNDPIPYNNEEKMQEKDRSKDCVVIKDLNTQSYIAKMIVRSHDNEYVNRQKMLGLRYYNNAKMNVERNAGAVTIKDIKRMGGADLLAREPKVLRSKSAKTIEIGWTRQGHTQNIAYGCYVEYLKQHHDKIYFMSIIESAETFLLKDNDDELDAMLSCELLQRDISDRQRIVYGKKVVKKIPYRTIENGKAVIKFQEILEESVDGNEKDKP